MKTLKFFSAYLIMSFLTASRVFASDINDIVYPPPEPERIVTEDNKTGDETDAEKMKPGITEEISDKDKMDKIYVYPDGRVLVPGTTPFEPVDAEKKRRRNSQDGSDHDGDEYHNSHHHNHNHHDNTDYQIEPVLSEKKGRVKSKLGITGPGHVIVPAKESNGIGR
ncbi:hypothetical protein [Desulforegula conservatrix]|uniref:hypothetical protein n=1 Tax=Desulforegula conservatrix TaxID=153026 RepID=UPI00041C20FE|nr:hypothetical protein [Desulforegula conservatrix]